MRRIAILCEVMHAPFDEGIRIYASELARSLSRTHETLLASERDSLLDGRPVHGALTDRWFLSGRLARLLRAFGPEAILYVSWTSLTSRALARAGVLRRRAPGAAVVLAALQPRPRDVAMKLMSRWGAPDLVAAVGPGAFAQARDLGLRAARIPPGVDAGRFTPAAPAQRDALRARAGIDPSRYVVLHVGHMKGSRGVGVLERMARLDGVVCVMVASSSTHGDERLAARLSEAGVILMSRHQERIEFAYRLADAYVFPVTSPLDAIEAPLSVLEAAACDLRIVATRFGALPDLLPAGVDWARDEEEMVQTIARLAAERGGSAGAGARRAVEGLTWDRSAAAILDAIVPEKGVLR